MVVSPGLCPPQTTSCSSFSAAVWVGTPAADIAVAKAMHSLVLPAVPSVHLHLLPSLRVRRGGSDHTTSLPSRLWYSPVCRRRDPIRWVTSGRGAAEEGGVRDSIHPTDSSLRRMGVPFEDAV